MKLEQLKIDPLPLLSPCYCDQCKKPLTIGRVMDKKHAWCPKCMEIVDTSSFQVKSWTVGVTVVLALQ
jgi:uncharacterized paraquat-inducible protein A